MPLLVMLAHPPLPPVPINLYHRGPTTPLLHVASPAPAAATLKDGNLGLGFVSPMGF
jgi:hypothetical protein